MSCYQIVFSPTGGTQKVTDILTQAFGEPIQTMDISLPTCQPQAYSFTGDDLVWISAPTFGGRIPWLFEQRMSLLKGNHARCILICVYGNRAYENALAQMEHLASKNGFRVVAAVAAIAEHSIARQVASGRPDELDKQQLCQFAQQIKSKLSSDHADSLPAIPGAVPDKDSSRMHLAPKANSSCSNCGLCASICPNGAISSSDPKVTEKEKCISCMRCISCCPQHARDFNKPLTFVVNTVLKKICSKRKEAELML